MSFDHIKETLETLCYYKDVEITHTFSKDGQPLISVCCVKPTETIQITFVQSQNIEYYENVAEATSLIKKVIN